VRDTVEKVEGRNRGHSRESGRQKQRGCLGRTPGQSLDSCSTEGDEAKLA